jgi:rare lipoprotein A (peptidoglycan hydrolase)
MLGFAILASVVALAPAVQSSQPQERAHAAPHHRHHHWYHAVASVYNDKGGTACGFHARYGVAHKTKPCGYHVRFRYHGHEVTATVDDRGPYIAGRTWDLAESTQRALRFPMGVDTVAYRHAH